MKSRSSRTPVRRGLVVYATKYGATREYAMLVAGELGWDALSVREATGEDIVFPEMVALGSPIYGFSVLPEMERFLERFHARLAGKVLAAFVVCGDTVWREGPGEGGRRNLEKLTRLLPHRPAVTAVLGGRMVMDALDEEDNLRIASFYRMLKRDPAGFDRMDPAAAREFAGRIRAAAKGL